MQCPACEYPADSRNGLLGHVNGKAQHEDPDGPHAELKGSAALEAAIGEDPPGGAERSDADGSSRSAGEIEWDRSEMDDPSEDLEADGDGGDGATDAEVREAVEDAERDEYAEQWGEDSDGDDDGGQQASSDDAGLLEDLPSGWLMVGTAVVLVVVLLVLLSESSEDDPETTSNDPAELIDVESEDVTDGDGDALEDATDADDVPILEDGGGA